MCSFKWGSFAEYMYVFDMYMYVFDMLKQTPLDQWEVGDRLYVP